MTAMLYCRQALGDGLYAADDGSGSILLVEAEGENSVSRMQVGVYGDVTGSPLLGPAREGSAEMLSVLAPLMINNVIVNYER